MGAQRQKIYSNPYGASKFDISLISNDDNPLPITGESEINHYLLPVSIAIELKLRFDGFNASNLIWDYEKLRKYKNVKHFLGIAILFEQRPGVIWEKQLERYINKRYQFRSILINDLKLEDDNIYMLFISILARNLL